MFLVFEFSCVNFFLFFFVLNDDCYCDAIAVCSKEIGTQLLSQYSNGKLFIKVWFFCILVLIQVERSQNLLYVWSIGDKVLSLKRDLELMTNYDISITQLKKKSCILNYLIFYKLIFTCDHFKIMELISWQNITIFRLYPCVKILKFVYINYVKSNTIPWDGIFLRQVWFLLQIWLDSLNFEQWFFSLETSRNFHLS